ncbi:MAG: PKD domain-containing protein [Cyclobacteriaceae bacterium]|nr:MAG: PKD domain-containing protein [Cyclobacteriaceae bacterium]
MVNLFSQTPATGEYAKSDYHANYIPKPSESASLGSFGNIPVNYFTGLPEISLPLITLTSRELSLPVSLNYDASGVRVDELAGQVGLKWTLNAGGYIARDMNGLPDEHPSVGYWKYALATDYWNNLSNASDWVSYSEKNERDTHPDEFVININGRSIRFVFDKYKRPVPIPRQNVKISYTLSNNKINRFEVTTEDGIKYIFGGDVTSVEERKIETLTMKARFKWTATVEWYSYSINERASVYYTGDEYFDNANENETNTIDFYNSKWFLKQIIAPSGDNIVLNYLKGSDVKYVTAPSSIRFSPVMVRLDEYTRKLKTRKCTFFGLICEDPITFTWVHPSPEGWTIHPATMITDPNYLLALRKFTEPVHGSGEPLPNFNTVNNRVPQAETNHYFKPESHAAHPGGVFMNHSVITESNIRLNSIVAANGNKITFQTSTREDLPGAVKYERVYLQNMDNVYVKSIKLNYATIETSDSQAQNDLFWISEAITIRKISSYSQSSTYFYPHYAKAYTETTVSNETLRKFVFEGLKAYNFKRLYLEGIVDETGGLNVPLYSFLYDGRNLLQRRTTPLSDGLRFAKVNANNELDFDLHSGKRTKIYRGYDPADASGVRVPTRGILKRITYPTKGYTEFQFGSVLGPQLQRILDFNEQANLISQKEIQYLNSINQTEGQFVSYANYELHAEEAMLDGTTSLGWMKNMIISSRPQNESSFRGPLTYYPKVRVYNGLKNNHNGYEDFVFTGSNSPTADEPDARDQRTPLFSNPSYSAPYTAMDIFPFPRKEMRDHLRGMLLEHIVYNNDGKQVKKVLNKYGINLHNYLSPVMYGFSAGTEPTPQNRKRYGRYKISADWIVLERTTETIFDSQNTPIGSFITVSEFIYDPQNLQQIESIKYNLADPSSKIVTKTKYVTHPDYNYTPTAMANCQQTYDNCMASCDTEPDPQVQNYCWQSCYDQFYNCELNIAANASPETGALVALVNNHQITSPVEIQNFVREQSDEKLISSVVYKYTREGSPTIFVKPKTIWGTKEIMNPSAYQTSKVESNGMFTADTRLRLLHSFDSYQQNTGNLLQQTSMDGIKTQYTWGHNNSLVTQFSVNPGSSISQTFSYNHKPLVGLNYVTDQNAIKYYYDYDRLNRLKLEKDNDGNITARYRYHYKTSKGFNTSISGTNYGIVGQSVHLSSSDDLEYGQISYEWNMGDGNIRTSTSVSHIYQIPGNYTVTLKKTNPEYGTVTITHPMTVNSPPSILIGVTGPTSIDLCNYNFEPTSFTATVRLGCPPYSFTWEYRYNGGSWITYASGSPVQAPPGFVYQEGYWEVRCTAYSGACNNQVTSQSIWLTTYRSDPNCFGGPIMHQN